jgi:hypothetical protein
MHYIIGPDGKRQSNHLMKDGRTFLNLQGAFGVKQAKAHNRGCTGTPGAVAHNTTPPPLFLAIGTPLTQVQKATNNNSTDGYITSKGAVNMIQPVPKSRKVHKSITRQVNWAITVPPLTREYLN